MVEVTEGAHPRPKPKFGLPEEGLSHSRRLESEGQLGAGLAGGVKIEVAAGTAIYESFSDIRGSGNPRAKGPQSFEEIGIYLPPSPSSVDESGKLKPTQIGNKRYIEVIVGIKLEADGKEVPDTRVVRFNDPVIVNRRRRGRRRVDYF